MENASKALIMAGGMLLAIVIITLGVYTYSSLHILSESRNDEVAQQELVDFNRTYEAFNKQLMYGTEVISIMNKANDNNKRYNQDNNYTIEISCELKSGLILWNSDYTDHIGIQGETFDEFKKKNFQCNGVSYNNRTGRINGMSFIEV